MLDKWTKLCIIILAFRRCGNLGDLCNGSTPDSDSVCGGSNPSSPAKKSFEICLKALSFLNLKYVRMDDTMEIRTAELSDLDAIAQVEAECFPAAEAATKKALEARLQSYNNHFWLLLDEGKLVSFVDGMVTDQKDLTDNLYENARAHDETGAWQMIFGVNTIPAYRKRGCAGMLLERAIDDAGKQGRRGLVLTCKERLLPYYAKFGFVNEGVSGSTHGGVTWYQMRLTF